ncbi:MAG TPA: FTR1 family protein [Candidatus Thermoplasmatota archaeon]|nr:FTR1 family protein [Candidatus Thermoplasmatota archaeon]
MVFVNTALVAVRESLEAFLILGILAGILRKSGQASLRKYILWGALAGLAASLLLGVLANGVARALYTANQGLFEAATSFLAVGVLTYMAIWMYHHTQELMGTLHRRTKEALAVHSPGMLVGLSFLAIFREGVETVLFTATNLPRDGATTTLLAIGTGILVSGLLAYVVFAGVVRLSIESFMMATGILLVFVAGGMLVYGLHELSETGFAHGLKDIPEAYDLRDWLPSNGHGSDPDINTWPEAVGVFLAGAVGYRDRPTWLEVGAWVAYTAIMLAWFWRALHKPRPQPAAPAPPTSRGPES